MRYQVNVIIEKPIKEVGQATSVFYRLFAEFLYSENDYGNGYHLSIEGDNFHDAYYDIRYDTEFRSDKPISYLTAWAESFWTGKNGSYKLKAISIMEI